MTQNKRHRRTSGVITGGRRRARAGAKSTIRAEVTAEFADKLQQAKGLFERARIRREIRREIKCRLRERAPFDALY